MKKEIKKSGFTLVEIMIVVMIIGLLAAIGIPNFLKARQNTLRKNAINNARQVMSAVDEYAMENAVSGTNAVVTSAQYTPYIKGGVGGLDIGSTTATLSDVSPISNTNAVDLAKTMYPTIFQ